MVKSRPYVVAAAAVVLAITAVAAFVLLKGGDEDDDGAVSGAPATAEPPFDVSAYPAIQGFMDQDATVVPEAVKQRLLEALAGGGLHPARFEQATTSWRACTEERCVGTVASVDASTVTLTSVLDGSEWSIGVEDSTRMVASSPALRAGDFVEVFAGDGSTADFIVSFSEPLQ